jgi:uncharacterized membrane protein
MSTNLKTLAVELLHDEYVDLTEREQRVINRIVEKRRISRNVNREIDDGSSRGERVADIVSRFGGSWTFIGIFLGMLVVWVAGNILIAVLGRHTFDPYPFIFLNLILSMLAAVQAPIIMMSQNRQSEKDRISAGHDYEVNLKAELEIMQLHEKLDDFRQRQLTDLVGQQTRQLEMMEKLLKQRQ